MHDPNAVFQQALACLQLEDFAGAAACCDPVSLRSFQRQMLSQYVPEEPVRSMTIEDMMRGAPDMPREVAEYNLRRHQEFVAQRRGVSRDLPDIADVAALQAAPAAAVFAAYLLGKSDRFQLRKYVETGELTEADLEASAAVSQHRQPVRILGVIPAGDRLAHLFYVREWTNTPASDEPWVQRELARIAALPTDERELLEELKGNYGPASTLCRRQPDGSWRLLASHDFVGSGGSIFISRHEPADEE